MSSRTAITSHTPPFWQGENAQSEVVVIVAVVDDAGTVTEARDVVDGVASVETSGSKLDDVESATRGTTPSVGVVAEVALSVRDLDGRAIKVCADALVAVCMGDV